MFDVVLFCDNRNHRDGKNQPGSVNQIFIQLTDCINMRVGDSEMASTRFNGACIKKMVIYQARKKEGLERVSNQVQILHPNPIQFP